MPRYQKILLAIEVHYFRQLLLQKCYRLLILLGLYLNGLGLQAVIEHWTNKAGGNDQQANAQSPASTTSSSFSTNSQNETYIKEVIDASRIILRHVVHDLLPNDYLKHAPVRAYFRIVSAAMFLLKVRHSSFPYSKPDHLPDFRPWSQTKRDRRISRPHGPNDQRAPHKCR